MNDKEYINLITAVKEAHSKKEIDKALPLLEQVQQNLSRNDLSIYLTLKSIQEDSKGNKNKELVLNEISKVVAYFEDRRFSQSERFTNFLIAVMSYTLIPALPFLANWLNNKQNTNENVVLSLAIYCISIALSMKTSRDRMIGIILSILVFLLVRENPTAQAMTASFVVTSVIFILHIIDRMRRHILNHEPYINSK